MFTTELSLSTEVSSPCEEWQWTTEVQAKHQMLIEIQNFQPQSNKLFGYLDNDDRICVDVDASSHGY
jgi:hypothetical protein